MAARSPTPSTRCARARPLAALSWASRARWEIERRSPCCSRSAIDARTAAQRQIHALVVAAPEALRCRFRDKTIHAILSTATRLRTGAHHDVETNTMITVLRSLARRVVDREAESQHHERALSDIVRSWRPDLLDQCGIGPVVAATLLCAWSHPGRFRSGGAFASLAGVAPIPASSGLTVRHRLNRSGDRQLNRALHVIVINRIRHDAATKAYVERRRAEGKSDREIKRCLKRYVARQLFRQLESRP